MSAAEKGPHGWSTLRKVAVGTVVTLSLLFLTIANTWPLLPNIDRAVASPTDPLILTWTLDHDWWATTHAPLQLFQAPIFWPSRYALAFSEHVYGIALFGFPLFAAGVAPLTVYNILMLLGFVLSGVGAYVLCRVAGASRFGSWCGGVFFAFVPFRFLHVSHLQHVWSIWVALTLAALLHYVKEPGPKRAMLFGAVFLMNGLSNVHWFLFVSFTVCASLLLYGALQKIDRAGMWRIVVAIVMATAFLLPFLLPYYQVEKLYHMTRSSTEVQAYSANLTDWLRAPVSSRVYGGTTLSRTLPGERALFPGFVVLLLSVAAFYYARRPGDQQLLDGKEARRLRMLDALIAASVIFAAVAIMNERLDLPLGSCRTIVIRGPEEAVTIALIALAIRFWIAYPAAVRNEKRSLRQSLEQSVLPLALWCALLWVGIGVIGSLGSNAFLHQMLFEHVKPFRAVRVPARWAIIAYSGLSILAAFGTDAVLALVAPPRRRLLVAVGVGGLLLLDLREAPMHWYLMDPKPAPVYTWLAGQQFRGGVLELPMDGNAVDYDYMFRSITHRKPIVNGVSGFVPATYAAVSSAIQADRTERLVPLLQRFDAPIVIVHAGRLYEQGSVIRSWIARESMSGKLVLLRRFDEGLDGVWVFGLRSLLNDAQITRISGLQPEERGALLPALLEKRAIPPAGVFGYVDSPVETAFRGRFRIFGWALSRSGIRSARARFDNGRRVIDLPLMPYPALSRHYAGFDMVTKPAFGVELDAPPGEEAGEHDLEIEVTDGTGKATRIGYTTFDWKPDRHYCPADWRSDQIRAVVRRLGGDETTVKAIQHGKLELLSLLNQYVDRQSDLSDRVYAEAIFRALLNREPGSAISDEMTMRLGGKISRRDLARELVNSDEFAEQNVKRNSRVHTQ